MVPDSNDADARAAAALARDIAAREVTPYVAAWDGDPAELPHRFLYFPDENHWVLAPQHAVLWYETVLAFLDHHVRGRDWVVPELLR